MDKIIKAVVFGGKARVALIETTEAVEKSIKLHKMSPLAAEALGRSLTIGAYISANQKNEDDRFNFIVESKGALGKIYVAGEEKGIIKGFLEHSQAELPQKDGREDIAAAVGKDGELVVIKDLGLKEPYVGRCEMVSGGLAKDFALYLFKSEGVKSAVALDTLCVDGKCKASGGVIVEALPSADENAVFMLEDIMSNFENFSALLTEKSLEEIAEFYFGHLDAEIFPAEPIKLKCNCYRKIRGIIRGLGRDEVTEIMREQGKIEIKCDYCAKKYSYTESDLDYLFGEPNG